jgi:hypothetical protein
MAAAGLLIPGNGSTTSDAIVKIGKPCVRTTYSTICRHTQHTRSSSSKSITVRRAAALKSIDWIRQSIVESEHSTGFRVVLKGRCMRRKRYTHLHLCAFVSFMYRGGQLELCALWETASGQHSRIYLRHHWRSQFRVWCDLTMIAIIKDDVANFVVVPYVCT